MMMTRDTKWNKLQTVVQVHLMLFKVENGQMVSCLTNLEASVSTFLHLLKLILKDDSFEGFFCQTYQKLTECLLHLAYSGLIILGFFITNKIN